MRSWFVCCSSPLSLRSGGKLHANHAGRFRLSRPVAGDVCGSSPSLAWPYNRGSWARSCHLAPRQIRRIRRGASVALRAAIFAPYADWSAAWGPRPSAHPTERIHGAAAVARGWAFPPQSRSRGLTRGSLPTHEGGSGVRPGPLVPATSVSPNRAARAIAFVCSPPPEQASPPPRTRSSAGSPGKHRPRHASAREPRRSRLVQSTSEAM